MDLRSFTAARRGAEFELQQLAARASPARVVLVVDPSTDRALVDRALASVASTPMAVFEVRRGRSAQADAAFAALLAAAS